MITVLYNYSIFIKRYLDTPSLHNLLFIVFCTFLSSSLLNHSKNFLRRGTQGFLRRHIGFLARYSVFLRRHTGFLTSKVRGFLTEVYRVSNKQGTQAPYTRFTFMRNAQGTRYIVFYRSLRSTGNFKWLVS